MSAEDEALWEFFGDWLKRYMAGVRDDPQDLALAAKTATCMMREMVPADLSAATDSPAERTAWLNSVRLSGGTSMWQHLQALKLARTPHDFTPGTNDFFCGICGESAGGRRHRAP